MTNIGSAPGRFLAVEGVDGAGKSTQLPRIEHWLSRRGVKTLTTREPGGTPFGESLRAVLLDPRFTGMAPMAELLVMFAARAEHLAKVIVPALEDGVWVLSERFTDATFAYQGGGRDLDPASIERLEAAVQGGIRPDLVLVLDIAIETGLGRAERRRRKPSVSPHAPVAPGTGCGVADRFEREDPEFFRRVRKIYLERARKQPERYAVIDASADEAMVTERMIGEISRRLL